MEDKTQQNIDGTTPVSVETTIDSFDIPAQQPFTNEMTTTPKQPKTNSIIKIILIIIGISAILGSIVYILGIIFPIAGELSRCSAGGTKLFSEKQAITDEFNNLHLIATQPDNQAVVTIQEGDCVDSLPTIYLMKTYPLSSTAGPVFTEMDASLKQNGFVAEKDGYPMLSPCSYDSRSYRYTKGENTLELSMKCVTKSTNGGEWKSIPVTSATAKYTVGWHYPQN